MTNRRNFFKQLGLAIAACVVPKKLDWLSPIAPLPAIVKPTKLPSGVFIYEWFIEEYMDADYPGIFSHHTELRLSMVSTRAKLSDIQLGVLSPDMMGSLCNATPLLFERLDAMNCDCDWLLESHHFSLYESRYSDLDIFESPDDLLKLDLRLRGVPHALQVG